MGFLRRFCSPCASYCTGLRALRCGCETRCRKTSSVFCTWCSSGLSQNQLWQVRAPPGSPPGKCVKCIKTHDAATWLMWDIISTSASFHTCSIADRTVRLQEVCLIQQKTFIYCAQSKLASAGLAKWPKLDVFFPFSSVYSHPLLLRKC